MIAPTWHVRLVPTHKVAALQPAARGQEPRGRLPAERTPIAGGEPRPENRGVVNLTQDGAPHERDQLCQSAASAYDRRYGCAQTQPAHAAQPRLQLQAVRRLAQTLARYGNARRGAAISAVSYRERCEHL